MIGRLFRAIEYVISGTVMSYNSLMFFICVLFFLGVLFLIRNKKAKAVWVLIANLVFYIWAGGLGGFYIIFLTALIVYLITRHMESIYAGYESEKEGLSPKESTLLLNEYKKKTRRYLWLALVLIIGVWIYVKVGKLYVTETVTTFHDWFLGKGIIVPLGISYYTLSSVAYLMDVYWRKTKPEHNFLYLFTAMSYFPHIVQGPIGRYQKIINQLHEIPGFDYKRVCYGLQLMIWGYIKKLVIADRIAIYTSAVFSEPKEFAGVEILIAVILSIFELYADFSGCMDIVRGISQAVGIDLDVNFRQPFFAKSAMEFWRRWHITLGGWTKEYIYMPIAVNSRYMRWVWKIKKKCGNYIGTLLNDLFPLLAVWLFTGLWHGNGWGYIFWGLYWFVLMMLSQATKPLVDKFINKFKVHTERGYYKCFQAVRTCLIFAIGRMFTVAGGLGGFAVLWKQLFAQSRIWTLFDGSLYTYGLDQKYFYVVLIGMIFMILIDFWHEKGVKIRETIAAMPLVLRWTIYFAALLVIVIFGVYGPGYDASSFIYGAF